jgi:hypothetical protein
MLLLESNFNTKNIIEDAIDGSPKKMYVEGIFMQAEVVNRNRRIYPKTVMESACNRYKTDYMARNMGASELKHPNSMEIDPDRIAARIVNIDESGNDYYGKALIVDTVCGRTAKALIEGGFTLGMSTRASGSVKKTKSGISEVQNDLVYHAIDLVMSPSSPDAYVSAIMESASPFWNTIEEYADANLIEDYKKEMQLMTVSQLNENKIRLFQQFMETLTRKS